MLAARAMSLATAALADADAIKTSIASDTSAASYSGAALNGTSALGGSDLASYPTVTTASQVGAYTPASTVRFTGTYGGATVVRTATITQANGNETQLADGPLDVGSVTLIEVDAQADTDGALTFGWSGVVPKKGATTQQQRPWTLVAQTAGNVHVGFQDGSSATIALTAGGQLLAAVARVYADTAVAVTLYE